MASLFSRYWLLLIVYHILEIGGWSQQAIQIQGWKEKEASLNEALDRDDFEAASQTLEALRRLSDKSPQAELVIGYLSGCIEQEKGQRERAIHSFRQLGLMTDLARKQNMVGTCLNRLGEPGKAKKYLKGALKTARKHGPPPKPYRRPPNANSPYPSRAESSPSKGKNQRTDSKISIGQ